MKKKTTQPIRPSHPSIERVRKIAGLMDSAFTIPIIRKKVGLDPLLGLLPVGGDVISALIAAYIIWVAVELRLPRPVVARMGVNMLFDLLLGAIPVVGDIADAVWKSNVRNLKVLEEAYHKYGIGPEYDEAGKDTPTTPQPVVDVVAEPVRS